MPQNTVLLYSTIFITIFPNAT